MTILFVDDDEDTRDLFEIIFSNLGHQIEMAVNGQEALSILENAHFDIVVVDYFMPDIDGLEMIRKYRASKPQKHTSFILFTRAHRGDLDQEARRLGISCLIHKPTVPSTLVNAVEQVALAQKV